MVSRCKKEIAQFDAQREKGGLDDAFKWELTRAWKATMTLEIIDVLEETFINWSKEGNTTTDDLISHLKSWEERGKEYLLEAEWYSTSTSVTSRLRDMLKGQVYRNLNKDFYPYVFEQLDKLKESK